MLNKFAIDYVILPSHQAVMRTHLTDDPIEAEEFLMHLLMGRARITEIRHSGSKLTPHQFDRMLKIAAERLVAGLLRETLQMDAEQVKDRFGFAA